MPNFSTERPKNTEPDRDFGRALPSDSLSSAQPGLLDTLGDVDVPDLPDPLATPPELAQDIVTGAGTNFLTGILRAVLKHVIESPNEKKPR